MTPHQAQRTPPSGSEPGGQSPHCSKPQFPQKYTCRAVWAPISSSWDVLLRGAWTLAPALPWSPGRRGQALARRSGSQGGHLVVSQCVQPLPVIVNLGGDILILQDDAGHAALAPLCREESAGGAGHWGRHLPPTAPSARSWPLSAEGMDRPRGDRVPCGHSVRGLEQQSKGDTRFLPSSRLGSLPSFGSEQDTHITAGRSCVPAPPTPPLAALPSPHGSCLAVGMSSLPGLWAHLLGLAFKAPALASLVTATTGSPGPLPLLPALALPALQMPQPFQLCRCPYLSGS